MSDDGPCAFPPHHESHAVFTDEQQRHARL